MEIKENHHLLQPLITTTTTTTTTYYSQSDSRVSQRYILIFFIGIISIWANYQASQGFEIDIINDANDTPAGRKFHLFFVSNGKATQIVLNASKLAEKIFYPDRQPKKPVSRVTVRLSNKTLTHQGSTQNEYVLRISSSVMESRNAEEAMVVAVQRGMSRVWLWNGEEEEVEIVNGMVEYVNLVGGFVKDYRLRRLPVGETKTCWKHWDDMEVARFLRYCEMIKSGFIGRLNQAMMQSGWHDQMVDDALGVPAHQLCGSYYNSTL